MKKHLLSLALLLGFVWTISCKRDDSPMIIQDHATALIQDDGARDSIFLGDTEIDSVFFIKSDSAIVKLANGSRLTAVIGLPTGSANNQPVWFVYEEKTWWAVVTSKDYHYISYTASTKSSLFDKVSKGVGGNDFYDATASGSDTLIDSTREPLFRNYTFAHGIIRLKGSNFYGSGKPPVPSVYHTVNGSGMSPTAAVLNAENKAKQFCRRSGGKPVGIKGTFNDNGDGSFGATLTFDCA